MKDAEATVLRIPGVTEAQVFAKVLVRCEFPMSDATIIALQEAQDWIEHGTGWKVEMTISAGKRPESVPVGLLPFDHPMAGPREPEWASFLFGDNAPKPKEEGI